MTGMVALTLLALAAVLYWRWELHLFPWYPWVTSAVVAWTAFLALYLMHALSPSLVRAVCLVTLLVIGAMACFQRRYRYKRLYQTCMRGAISVFCLSCLIGLLI